METFAETLARLGSAQKGAARSAPAYSRFVNRRLGRVCAAVAYRLRLTPNQVSAASAVFTFSGVVLLALLRPSWGLGLAVCLLLVVGYALDSADGQVARLTGTGSPVGEWLDHVIDSVKVVSLPLALLVGLFRADVVDDGWLLVPLVNAIVWSVLFFGMMITEQLRRAHGAKSEARTKGRLPWLRSVLVLPTDYGLLCLSFVVYGEPHVFLVVFAVITLGMLGFVGLALPKWYRDIRALPARIPGDV